MLPATLGAKAEELLEPRSFEASLGNTVRLHLKNKFKIALQLITRHCFRKSLSVVPSTSYSRPSALFCPLCLPSSLPSLASRGSAQNSQVSTSDLDLSPDLWTLCLPASYQPRWTASKLPSLSLVLLCLCPQPPTAGC